MQGVSPALQQLDEQIQNKVEWRYEMRREAQETLPGVYVGPFQPSWKLQTLQDLGITHVLCIAESREQHLFTARFPELITYLILEIRDADDQNLIRIFPQTQAFIDSALEAGGKVLVHCGDGISRSPAVVTAYVMCKTSLSHEDAFMFVQSRRFCIAPRVEFQHQLEAYGPIFMASQMMASDAGARSGQNSRRRGREDDDDDEDGGNDDMVMDEDRPQSRKRSGLS
ncbi:phosphatases II [Meredithblackwellia eburnea MCA 4105]